MPHHTHTNRTVKFFQRKCCLQRPTPCRRVFGHGFLTKDGLKMGKALGNTLDPQALVSMYGADAVRFYFLKEIVFG